MAHEMTPMIERVAVYACVSKWCRAKGQEFRGAVPSVVRQATGGFVRCPRCGDVVRMRRIEEAK